MKVLTVNEIAAVHGASHGAGQPPIHISDWVLGTIPGMLVGAAVFTVTAFSPNPITLGYALTLGASIGAGVVGLYDVLHAIEKKYSQW